mgnify:CR=1 FL=1
MSCIVFTDKNGNVLKAGQIARSCKTYQDYLNPRNCPIEQDLMGNLLFDKTPIEEYHAGSPTNGYCMIEIVSNS